MAPSIYWYDFETFGDDPRRDRASQFAGLRTDEALNVLGDPLVMYCQPAPDFLPNPMACLITGITPQQALAEGLPEVEFVTRIHREFMQLETCVAGYNSIRFDDEVSRQLLYRNFFDPYEREWQGGNSRWDIIDMLRLCAAVRPEGIEWPKRPDGAVSFRLEELTAANGIEHSQAHDALADVTATIAMAALVRDQQRKLYDYVYRLRDKHRVMAELDLQSRKPVLHISGMYPAYQGSLALVMPVCRHPINKNAVIVYDLRADPSDWLGLEAEEIRARLFASQSELPEGESRIALKAIHANRCPIVVPPSVLPDESTQRFGIDLSVSRRHWEQLAADTQVVGKLRKVFSEEDLIPETDPDFMIYSGGFFSESDRDLMRTVRSTNPVDLARLDLPFRDRRLAEMLFRYRARNFPETLSADEEERWQKHCAEQLHSPAAWRRYLADMDEARERAGPEQQALLDHLEDYVSNLATAPATVES